ncbi:hypothetical protein PV325_011277 [Microctonus aethiopoides]|nr:hypothetical protein PV325_011277 [Microctonus aethiopoides]
MFENSDEKYSKLSSLVQPFTTITVRFILSSMTTSVHSLRSNTKSIFRSPVLDDPLAGFGNYQFRYSVTLSGDPLAGFGN